MSRSVGLKWEGRRPGEGQDLANRLLDHGNYLAYGLAAVTLWALGLPPSLPVTHGASRAGGLVFDLADVIKDAIVLPSAFHSAATSKEAPEESFRSSVIERLYDAHHLDKNGALGLLFKVVDRLIEADA